MTLTERIESELPESYPRPLEDIAICPIPV